MTTDEAMPDDARGDGLAINSTVTDTQVPRTEAGHLTATVHPNRVMRDGPCFCISNVEAHEGWIHGEFCLFVRQRLCIEAASPDVALLREALLDRAVEAHTYGLVSHHWKPDSDGPTDRLEDCPDRLCREAAALAATPAARTVDAAFSDDLIDQLQDHFGHGHSTYACNCPTKFFAAVDVIREQRRAALATSERPVTEHRHVASQFDPNCSGCVAYLPDDPPMPL